MTLTKRQLFNAKNAGVAIESGLEIEVVGVGQFADKNKDGLDVTVTCLLDANGTIYTTISGTISESAEMLSEIIDEEGAVTIKVNQNTSNGGREFYTLEIL